MNDFAGNLRPKFISFCHLGFESSANNLPGEWQSENPQIIAQTDEGITLVMNKTSNSPAKIMSVLHSVQVVDENVGSEVEEKDCKLTMAERYCVLTSCGEEWGDLHAFVNENLQFMTEKFLEQLVGDGSMFLKEMLCGSVAAVSGPKVGSVGNAGTDQVDQGRTLSACPGLTPSGIMEVCGCEVSSREHDEVDII